MNHLLMENRHGPVVDVAATEANGKAECRAALKPLAKHARRGATGGADIRIRYGRLRGWLSKVRRDAARGEEEDRFGT